MTARRRKSLRLQGYDYASPGAYFVTVCTADRVPLFGNIRDGRVVLTRFGTIVSDNWRRVIGLQHGAGLDEFIVMPDHFHAIVWLNAGNAVNTHHSVGRLTIRPSPAGMHICLR